MNEPFVSIEQLCVRSKPATDRPPAMQHVTGVGGSAPALVAARLLQGSPRPLLYVAPNETSAQVAHANLQFLLRHNSTSSSPPPSVALLLASETNPYDALHPDRRSALARLAVLSELATGEGCRVVVTSGKALCRKVLPPQHFHEASLRLAEGQVLELDELVQQLSALGYTRTPLVEDPGSFAVRGGLVDVWPGHLARPARVDLFGDTIAEVKAFDPTSQRSAGRLGSVLIPPGRQLLVTEQNRHRTLSRLREQCDAARLPSGKTRLLLEDVTGGRSVFGAEGYLPAMADLVPLWQFLPSESQVLLEEPTACVKAIEEELQAAKRGEQAVHAQPHFPLDQLFLADSDIAAHWRGQDTLCCHRQVFVGNSSQATLSAFCLAPENTPSLQIDGQQQLARALHGTAGSNPEQSLDPLVQRLRQWYEDSLQVAICTRTEVQANRLRALLRDREVVLREQSAPVPLTALSPTPKPLVVCVGSLRQGLIAPSEGLVLLTEEEIFGKAAQRASAKRRTARNAVEDLRALAPGDPVVHVEHGIGRYRGLEHKQLNGQTAVDLLVIEYRGGDKLYVPVYRMNQVQKLGSNDPNTRLDKLGGQTFAKTKAKARRKVRDMADELLGLYAERQNSRKQPLGPVDDNYRAFEASFPYEETADQGAAIVDVLEDLEKPQVMDRLICGDVGFGKTEVALRAAFRHIVAGRQVALLCPTTVLANQHFQTVCQRFAEHPVTAAMLSRFRSKTQQATTLKELQEGRVDLCVGTHRLLSKDVHFKRLGLLIVDEEQRFGVAAKERIKQLKKDVDVLTLSATPIPRTLQMAVGGLQDLSIIATAPGDRLSIRTSVAQYDENLIREVVERELDRGGQVYYVHNRVEGLVERAAMLQKLVPRARIAVGHGQLRESELERTMLDFIEGRADVLMATAIVESGLDIPRANTLIVDRADLFGLAQLYQLRGRVGRSNTRAHCYLLVPSPSRLSDEARMRVEALTRYTQLGSGLQIAEMDLELRGAGDFLGAEQSGTVQSIGFELFCQMLEEATQELSGLTVRHEVDPEISLDTEALLPEDYVSEIGVRLSLYKRLASCTSAEEVVALAVELEDRFGPLPPSAACLIELMELKTELRKLRATHCDASARSVTLHLLGDTPLKTDKVLQWVATDPQSRRITPRGQVIRSATAEEQQWGGLRLAASLVKDLHACQ